MKRNPFQNVFKQKQQAEKLQADALRKMDAMYEEMQEYAKSKGLEQLLAKAVCWSAKDQQENDGIPVEQSYITARRTIAFQSFFHQEMFGDAPENVWAALIDENTTAIA